MDERANRPRRNTEQSSSTRPHPLATPERGLSSHTGPIASAQWLVRRGIATKDPRWFIEVGLEVAGRDTCFRLDVYAEEWGFELKHDGRSSWIRVTDVRFAHGPDDLGLLANTPRLHDVPSFIAGLERDLGVRFDRETPRIRSNIPEAYAVVREWIAST